MVRPMSDSSSLERRQAKRVPLAIAIELGDERGFSLYSSQDLSTGGAFFDRAIPYPVGQRVTVSFTLPGEPHPIRCQGEVVNVPDHTCFGMGVRFSKMRPEDERALEAFTAQLNDPASP
jgi:uncharacterized protein (TIGR02266 family)